ncbi:unnamed protein product [Tuber aestivum]|uniref:Uncharacterized protein n=1 Tax=Tuber aestivum TaxID=59557 RepID=A0A292PXZ6_9PEZI|nr:unnamed protein product [Tuber aestivum]
MRRPELHTSSRVGERANSSSEQHERKNERAKTKNANKPYKQLNKQKMPFTYSKGFGGRRFGWGVSASRHGVRPHARFSCCGFNCFR